MTVSYGNVLAGAPAADVTLALGGHVDAAYVLPLGEPRAVVYPDDEEGVADLAQVLSAQLPGPALAAHVRDSQVLVLGAYRDGELLDAYNSQPGFGSDGPVGGDVKAYTQLGLTGVDLPGLEQALRGGFASAEERHAAVLRALGLPVAPLRFGYRAIRAGDIPPELADKFRPVGSVAPR
ncbi:hypothetical protein TH66_07595 [Carbonactinospora thermoautotrophica]|uniref:Uncharacterized protein n=1 Tax=Carbonactinospora thermoautotrophica TaxID=1469144 RepID=A0A132NDS6_9ACTN|nr:hypothetical protein [Carbonactinospora thermoautotrophica]KWW99834.1 hypothetical protein LI90_1473 [Carbonactinospora thermoautotrophica]KWX04441.1 hypothetical protein TH66_07595 [Carbonactinospora thermoautotrophica]KWX08271.1 hypothetical protein TR74_15725 [Carbonactinospora thermoautotrophica]